MIRIQDMSPEAQELARALRREIAAWRRKYPLLPRKLAKMVFLAVVAAENEAK